MFLPAGNHGGKLHLLGAIEKRTIFASKVNSESFQRQINSMSKCILEPDTNLHDVPDGIRDEMHIDLLAQGNIGDTDLMIEE